MMKKAKIVLFILLMGMGFLAAAEKDAVQVTVSKAFTDYCEAALSENGEKAYATIDKKTRDYYDRLYDLAIYADKELLKKSKLLDRLCVIILRGYVPAEQLLKMSGKKVFIFSIENGLVDKQSVQSFSVGKVKIEGNSAKAEALINGAPTGITLSFQKEAEGWKFGLCDLLVIGEIAFQKILAESGKTEDEIFKLALEGIGVENVDIAKLYEPLKKRGE